MYASYIGVAVGDRVCFVFLQDRSPLILTGHQRDYADLPLNTPNPPTFLLNRLRSSPNAVSPGRYSRLGDLKNIPTLFSPSCQLDGHLIPGAHHSHARWLQSLLSGQGQLVTTTIPLRARIQVNPGYAASHMIAGRRWAHHPMPRFILHAHLALRIPPRRTTPHTLGFISGDAHMAAPVTK